MNNDNEKIAKAIVTIASRVRTGNAYYVLECLKHVLTPKQEEEIFRIIKNLLEATER